MIPGRPIALAIGIPLDDQSERTPIRFRALPRISEGVSPQLNDGRLLIQQPGVVSNLQHVVDDFQPFSKSSRRL